VPRDGLAFAVRIGGNQDLVGIPGRGLKLGNRLLLPLDRDELGLELRGDVNTQLALGQVPDVAHGGLHREAPSQVLADRSRLRGRLDHDERAFLGHETPLYGSPVTGASSPPAERAFPYYTRLRCGAQSTNHPPPGQARPRGPPLRPEQDHRF
jgi:hypothetical protein